MTVANKLQSVGWEDWRVGPWYAIFERLDRERAYAQPSAASWTRLMRTMTVRHVKAAMKPTLRQHAMMEFIDRKAEQAEAKAKRK